jgi:hypothetical protein
MFCIRARARARNQKWSLSKPLARRRNLFDFREGEVLVRGSFSERLRCRETGKSAGVNASSGLCVHKSLAEGTKIRQLTVSARTEAGTAQIWISPFFVRNSPKYPAFDCASREIVPCTCAQIFFCCAKLSLLLSLRKVQGVGAEVALFMSRAETGVKSLSSTRNRTCAQTFFCQPYLLSIVQT